MKNRIIITVLCLLPLWATCLPASAAAGAPAADNLLQEWLAPISSAADQSPGLSSDEPIVGLALFYRQHQFQPAWLDAHGWLASARILLQAVQDAAAEGLAPRDYDHLETGERMINPVDDRLEDPHALDADRLRLDMALTALLIKYCTHLSQGRVRPEALFESDIYPERPPRNDLPQQLAKALSDERLGAFIASLRPKHTQYAELKSVLERYRQIAAAGGWPQIPAGPELRPGATDERVAVLRRHLVVTGDLAVEAPDAEDRFDAILEAALKQFQERHGLAADGVVGKSTLVALNIPVEARIIQLELNMERWRWMPDTLPARYLAVNIPAFELKLVDNDEAVLAMRAIVGQTQRPTPILSGLMSYIELNPYWNIPQKIAGEDILPKIQSDPQYLSRQGIQVFNSWQEDAPALDPLQVDWSRVSQNYFPYRLRQVPTAHNALGRVKFMFSNPYSIYIHDTPGKSLFNKPQRNFSSGCVRVEHPLALAAQILKGQGWDRRRLKTILQTERPHSIALDSPLPVYLLYFTAWTDAEQRIHFAEDVYQRDLRLYQALNKTSPPIYFCGSAPEAGSLAGNCSSPPHI
jgi:murein L,D-transpeptidase YcbB/YkuD